MKAIKKITIICALIVIIDRILKMLVESFLDFGIRNIFFNNFFYLALCKNEDAAFSILDGMTLFLIIIGAISLYLIYKFIKNDNIFREMKKKIYKKY